MRKINLKDMVIAGISAAMIFVITFFVKIPVPVTQTGAYINLGDTIIFIIAFLINPFYAMLAAGIGSFLADLLGGYGQYMVASLIIKGLMGLVACYIMKNGGFVRYLLGCIVGGLIMVCGYFAFEYFVFGSVAAILNMPFNLIQFTGSIIVAGLLYQVIVRLKKEIYKKGN